MKRCIGIREEDKYPLERRVAIIPRHVRQLIEQHGFTFYVQRSAKRIFTDQEYEQAGAILTDNLSACDVIFGVKEIPEQAFEPEKTYVFFAHVIKGQPYNMPMLRRMMELRCNLIDYEKVEDDLGRRLIFFGRYAGLAGAINTLWSFGMRYRELGIQTPFTNIRQTYTYNSLDEARRDIAQVGIDIIRNGLPSEISPFIIAVTGYGNVSSGVNEILSLLPVKEILPEQIPQIASDKSLPRNVIYKAVFKEIDLVRRKDGGQFVLEEYYEKPHLYEDQFQQYIPYLNGIINGMYWDDRYPRIVTKSYLKELFSVEKMPRLTVIGDITCDPNGSIECTHQGTPIDNPVFVYHPDSESYTYGFKGHGVLVMAVDILPSELPREASEFFSTALKHFVPAIANANFSKSYDELDLPSPIKKALILHKGQLTSKYQYIENYLKKQNI